MCLQRNLFGGDLLHVPERFTRFCGTKGQVNGRLTKAKAGKAWGRRLQAKLLLLLSTGWERERPRDPQRGSFLVHHDMNNQHLFEFIRV